MHAARLPALTPSELPPLAVLAGGPGQSAIEIGGGVGKVFHELLADRDIIFLEQRGTGNSNGIKCASEDDDPYEDLYSDAESEKLVAQCLADFEGDLSHYNTPNAIHDFAAMVRALGYPKVHLYGGSYGSRAALVFMRLYPDMIASTVLDGMAPVQVVVGPFARHGQRALELLFDECETTPSCQQRYPNLRRDYWQLWAAIKQRNVIADIYHPTTLAPHKLRLDGTKFFQLTLSYLYSQEQRQLLPFAIDAAAKGHWQPFAGLIAAGGDNGMYTGLTTNILCNEDMRRASTDQLAADSQSMFGDASIRLLHAMCAHWPGRYQLDKTHFEPVTSAIPTLALSGNLDPVTPPAWGDSTVTHLSNATHIVAEQAAHIVAMRGCGPKLVRQFLNDPSAPLEKTDCLADLPSVTFMRSNNAH
nr:alpha/beta hydrolase [Simiduia aestuariiviva]